MISVLEFDESKSGQMVFEKVKLACIHTSISMTNKQCEIMQQTKMHESPALSGFTKQNTFKS